MTKLKMCVRSAILRAASFLCCVLAFDGQAAKAENALPPASDPMISIHDGFVDEKTCVSCHADQAAAFAKSSHAKAMALATDGTVRADFNDTQFQHDGISTTFFRRAGRFFVRTEGHDGKEAEFEVKYKQHASSS